MTVLKNVKRYFNDPRFREKALFSEENEKDLDRIEQRVAYSTDDIEWLQKEHKWTGLKSIGMVRSTVEKNGKKYQEQRFYISSLSADPKQLNQVARFHWEIENQGIGKKRGPTIT